MSRARQLSEASDGRYEIIEPLGAGGSANVYLAREIETDHLVVAKDHRLTEVPDWKTWELISRGADVLKTLEHPGVPRLREVLRKDQAPVAHLWVIEEFIPGHNLEQLMEAGERPTASQACLTMACVLEILDHLHTRTPPVVHRDVKPSNIIVRPEGSVCLIDFGAVQQVLRYGTLQGSTVVGTFGYMPPEQFMGQAEPASDLYAVGATLLYLLTGKEPSEFQVRDMRLQTDDTLGTSPVVPILNRLLDPRVENRFPSAKAVERALEQVADQLDGRSGSSHMAQIHGALNALRRVREPTEGEREAHHDLTCPHCEATMEVTRLGEDGGLVEVDLCPSCGGVWFDLEELETLTSEVHMALRAPNMTQIRQAVAELQRKRDLEPVIYRKCPRCAQYMHRQNYMAVSGVIIDSCVRHGLFLDGGELAQIVAFIRAGGVLLSQFKQHERVQAEWQRRRQQTRSSLMQPAKHSSGGSFLMDMFF